MRLYIDLDTRNVISQPDVRQQISTLNFKRVFQEIIEVQFVRYGVIQELPSDATGTFGMKQVGDYDQDYVAAALAWVKSGTGTGTVYTFNISFLTMTLNGLFGVDNDVTNDVAAVTLMGEIVWVTGGEFFKSNTLSCVVANDVNRGTESVPTTLPVALATVLRTITRLTGGTETDLDAIQLGAYPNFCEFAVVIEGRGASVWQKQFWTGIGTPVTDTDAGLIVTLDYNATTMNYVLIRVSGF